MYFSEKGSKGFTRLSKIFMARNELRTTAVDRIDKLAFVMTFRWIVLFQELVMNFPHNLDGMLLRHEDSRNDWHATYRGGLGSAPRQSMWKVGRFHPFIGHKGPYGEYRYSSTLFLTSALEGGEGSASRPDRNLPPGKNRYPLYRRLGGPQGRSGQVRKISPPPGFDPRTVQAVGSCYIYVGCVVAKASREQVHLGVIQFHP
jgi:hypothetical protein